MSSSEVLLILTDGAVGGDSPPLGVVAEQLQLPLGGLPRRVLLSYAWTHTHTRRSDMWRLKSFAAALWLRPRRPLTLQLPGFPLLFFGNLLDVFVVDVVLAHETVNPAIQQVYS